MFDHYNFSGYDLYQPFENIDQWVIDMRNGQSYHGTLKQVIKYMIQRLDFYFEDIEEGLEVLAGNSYQEHNSCHFGLNKTFIYSFKKKIEYQEAS